MKWNIGMQAQANKTRQNSHPLYLLAQTLGLATLESENNHIRIRSDRKSAKQLKIIKKTIWNTRLYEVNNSSVHDAQTLANGSENYSTLTFQNKVHFSLLNVFFFLILSEFLF